MKVLIVSRSKGGRFAAFVEEQVAELQRQGITCVYFPVKRKGFGGYIRYLPELNRMIRSSKPDLIHAHYGLCGLLANLQREVTVSDSRLELHIGVTKHTVGVLAVFLVAFREPVWVVEGG